MHFCFIWISEVNSKCSGNISTHFAWDMLVSNFANFGQRKCTLFCLYHCSGISLIWRYERWSCSLLNGSALTTLTHHSGHSCHSWHWHSSPPLIPPNLIPHPSSHVPSLSPQLLPLTPLFSSLNPHPKLFILCPSYIPSHLLPFIPHHSPLTIYNSSLTLHLSSLNYCPSSLSPSPYNPLSSSPVLGTCATFSATLPLVQTKKGGTHRGGAKVIKGAVAVAQEKNGANSCHICAIC